VGCHGFSLSYFELGVLGSLTYIAVSLVSPLVGVVLQRSPVRRVLLLSVVINGIACLLFGIILE
jgi:sugar phosphate permease